MDRYWNHVYSQHADYNVLINDLGDFLMYKAGLYIPQNLTKTILQEYHDVWSFHPDKNTRKDLRVILLATDSSQYMGILQELHYMSEF